MRDVIVIGAGPAGLAAAEGLAGRGHDVLVLEEHALVGDPVHCTGVIGREVFDELRLPREAILSQARSAEFLAPDGTSVVVDSDRIVAAVIDRGEFDRRLAGQAIAAGATVRTGVRVRKVEVQDEAVVVRTAGDAGPLRARACVLACGAKYRFNRDLGLGVPKTFVQTAQVEIPFIDRRHVEVQFGRSIAPGGFAWMVPFRRETVPHARLGIMCDRDVRRRFEAFVTSLERRLGMSPLALPRPRLKFLPLAPVSRTYAARVLAVGDAAGLVKPTTGGGIYYSLLSGRLAADTLGEALAHDALGERHLREYELAWRERLGPEIRAGLAFRAIAARLSDRHIQALVDVARVDGIVPLLKQTADFNWHRAAVLALFKNAAFRKIVFGSILN